VPLFPNYYRGLREQIKPGARICVHLEDFDFIFERNAFTEQTYFSFDIQRTAHRDIFLQHNQRVALISLICFGIELYVFRTGFLSIIRLC
jgi:hypothetical protein